MVRRSDRLGRPNGDLKAMIPFMFLMNMINPQSEHGLGSDSASECMEDRIGARIVALKCEPAGFEDEFMATNSTGSLKPTDLPPKT